MAEYDNKDYKQTPFSYRITGKQSIERLDPIILSLVPNQSLSGCNAADRLDFVWETTCEKSLRAQHQSACILNKLHNSQIIESKSMLAYLQLLVDFPMLETFVAENASSVEMWAKRRWNKPTDNNCSNLRDWWVVKASKGNGGRDIWIMYEENCEKVVSDLPSSDEYVIQRYCCANNVYNFNLIVADCSFLSGTSIIRCCSMRKNSTFAATH